MRTPPQSPHLDSGFWILNSVFLRSVALLPATRQKAHRAAPREAQNDFISFVKGLLVTADQPHTATVYMIGFFERVFDTRAAFRSAPGLLT